LDKVRRKFRQNWSTGSNGGHADRMIISYANSFPKKGEVDRNKDKRPQQSNYTVRSKERPGFVLMSVCRLTAAQYHTHILATINNARPYTMWGAHPEFFIAGRGAGPEAIYNLCLILKIVL